MEIKQMQKEVYDNAKAHGWWDDGERNFGELIALCHSELSEALEESRKGKGFTETYYREDGKPEVNKLCEHYGIDLEAILLEKHEFNKKRPYKHGKNF